MRCDRIKSPGKPVLPITIEAIKNFTATSYSRNKKLTFIFSEMEYMEESALGMDTFKSLREKYGLPLPIVDYDGSNVVVIFPRTTQAIKEVSLRKGVKNLNKEELLGFEFVKLKGKLKRKEYEQHFSFDKKKAERHLNKMIGEALIERKGSGPAIYYQIIET